MIVPRLRYPGTFIAELEPEQGFEAFTLLCLLEQGVTDAAISLRLYREAQQSLTVVFNRAMRELEMNDNGTTTSNFANPEWPEEYVHRLPFLCAKSFVYALDNIGKALNVMTCQQWAPGGTKHALSAWIIAFPTLQGVRNTSHHHEDRIRGKGNQGKTITTASIDTRAIVADPGSAIVLDNLDGDRYGCTGADGKFVEIEVTEASLDAARNIVQMAIDAFAWFSSPRIVPRPATR